MCDLLWSNPSSDINFWCDNVDRGVSFYFVGIQVLDIKGKEK